MRKPPWWASKGAALAARGLPAGPIRERYEQEFLAELYAMTRWQAARYVFGVVASAPRLRRVLACDIDRSEQITARPATCRLNLHHDWHMFHTEDGGRYKACLRCHKEHPEWRYYLWRYPGDNIRRSFGA
ncbi:MULTISPECIES: hypothetical protein [Nocardioides]|uniref:HNH endonuclease n=1 Tax=Nocardioides vastitatis TaxID=2568655 RepID=A0ABW0ZK47_9ACTN|nr:hypothetical protein [Nocardioides sp.]THI94392.1 hypothetical protein E7Z54_20140 [Nocardioides sp.]